MTRPRFAPVLPLGVNCIAAVTDLAAAADERHVLLQLLAVGTRQRRAVPGGRAELVIVVDEDVAARLEDAAEVLLPDPESPLSRSPFSA